MIFYLICLALAVAGFYISFKIYKEKHSGKPMVCPIDGPEGSCETVLTSKYSKIAGIGVEYLGIVYYGTLVVLTLKRLLGAYSRFSRPDLILFGMVCCGLLFTIYLIIIQKFVIKKWCTWCLLSAATTASIFVVLLIKLLFHW